MNFTEKLAKLVDGKNKSQIARQAGLSATAITDYLQKGYIPRADNALTLARALNVNFEWLIDDDQGWPPPPASAMLSLSTEQLTAELGRRLLSIGTVMLGKIARAQHADWMSIADELLTLDVNAELPKRLREMVELPAQLNSLEGELDRYDPRASIGQDIPAELLKEVLPGFEITLLNLWTQKRNLYDRPGYSAASRLGFLWLVPQNMRPPAPWFNENIAHARETAAAELEAIRNAPIQKSFTGLPSSTPENKKSTTAPRRKIIRPTHRPKP